MRSKNGNRALVFMCVIAFGVYALNLSSCGRAGETNSESDTDSDTDTDSDSDTDADSDTSTDTPDGGNDDEITIPWAVQAGGLGDDRGSDIAVFSDDSFVLTGGFGRNVYGPKSAVFGHLEPGEVTIESDCEGVYLSAGYVARYNPDGTLAWAKSFPGVGYSFGISVSALQSDDALVLGGYGDLGEDYQDPPPIPPRLFISRYEPDGTVKWTKWSTGTGDCAAEDIAAYSDGSFLVTGYFRGSITFGEGETNETTLIGQDGPAPSDTFFARYDTNGSLIWVKHLENTYSMTSGHLELVDDSSFYLIGICSNQTVFGPGEPNETILSAFSGSSIAFIAKYNFEGELAWVIGDDEAGVMGISGTAAFPDGSLIVTRGYSMALYNPEGVQEWSKPPALDLGDDSGFSVMEASNSTSETFYLTGHFRGTVTFGAGDPNEITIWAFGQQDAFLASYNRTDGTLGWVEHIVSDNDYESSPYDPHPSFPDDGRAIACTSDGSAIFTGTFDYEATFDENITLDAMGERADIYIARRQL